MVPVTIAAVCVHGHHPDRTTKVRRILGLGLRPICDPCMARLEPLYGSQIERAPIIRCHEMIGAFR